MSWNENMTISWSNVYPCSTGGNSPSRGSSAHHDHGDGVWGSWSSAMIHIMGTSLEYVGNMLGISSINMEKNMQKYIYIYVIYIYIPPISNTAYSWVQICVNPQQNTKVSWACWIWTGEGIKELSPLYWNHFQDGFPFLGNLDTKNAWQIKLE